MDREDKECMDWTMTPTLNWVGLAFQMEFGYTAREDPMIISFSCLILNMRFFYVHSLDSIVVTMPMCYTHDQHRQTLQPSPSAPSAR